MAKKVKLTCHILLLIGPTDKFRLKYKLRGGSSKYYEKQSTLVLDVLKTLPEIEFKKEIEHYNYEEWLLAHFKLPIEKNDKINSKLEVELQYYKSRLYLKISTEVEDKKFLDLIVDARKFWKKIETAWYPFHVKLEMSNDNLKFFKYPLIEVGKNYELTQYEQLGDEAKTTFFYEVNDPYPYPRLLGTRSALIRFGRPSIIISKMSDHSKNNLINAIYHACLDWMRETTDESEKKGISAPGYNAFLDYEGYKRAREFMEDIFYTTQAATSQILESHYVFLFTLIFGLAAIPTILTIIYVVPLYEGSLPVSEIEVKSFIGFILLVPASLILTFLIWKIIPVSIRQNVRLRYFFFFIIILITIFILIQLKNWFL